MWTCLLRLRRRPIAEQFTPYYSYTHTHTLLSPTSVDAHRRHTSLAARTVRAFESNSKHSPVTSHRSRSRSHRARNQIHISTKARDQMRELNFAGIVCTSESLNFVKLANDDDRKFPRTAEKSQSEYCFGFSSSSSSSLCARAHF